MEQGYEDPVGISVEPNEEDGFVMNMEDHGPDWDEDSVHIEVEDELRHRRRDAQVRVGSTQSHHRPKSLPKINRIAQVDRGAGVWKGFDMSTEA